MRDLLFGLGLACFALFGSALDSPGRWAWVAAAGVIVGLLMMVAAQEGGK